MKSLILYATLATLALMFVLSGCSDKKEGGEDSQSQANPRTSESHPPSSAQADTGVLVGRVLFEGTVPPPRVIEIDKDVESCNMGGGEVQEVVVSVDNALADVVIEIQGLEHTQDATSNQSENSYEIRQKDCRFEPELLVVPDGAELTIYNEDTVLHNINAGFWNIAQPAGFRPLTQKITFMRRPFVRIHCNIHHWMQAWIYVAKSSHYTVTDADGRFTIENIPPGTYTVTASHSKLGSESFEITVTGGQQIEHNLTLKLTE